MPQYKGFVRNSIEYQELLDVLEDKFPEDIPSFRKRRLIKKASNFYARDKKLFLKSEESVPKLVIPLDAESEMVFHATLHHQEEHPGINKMEFFCRKHFFLIKSKIIRKVVKECDNCKFSLPLKTGDESNHVFASFPNERFQIDLIDLKRFSECNRGFKWMLTVIDIYSRFAFIRPLMNKSSQEVVKNLESLFNLNGPCKILQSDNGSEFKNRDLADLCKRLKIEFIHGRPNNPRSQGIVERFNQTITRIISKMLFGHEEKRWIDVYEKAIYSYNTRMHCYSNESTFMRYRGIDAINCLDVSTACEEEPAESTSSAEEVEDCSHLMNRCDNGPQSFKFHTRVIDGTNKYYKIMNKKMNVHESRHDFAIGDKVRCLKDYGTNPSLMLKKFESCYSQPCEIVSILSNSRVEVIDSDGQIINVSMYRLKK